MLTSDTVTSRANSPPSMGKLMPLVLVCADVSFCAIWSAKEMMGSCHTLCTIMTQADQVSYASPRSGRRMRSACILKSWAHACRVRPLVRVPQCMTSRGWWPRQLDLCLLQRTIQSTSSFSPVRCCTFLCHFPTSASDPHAGIHMSFPTGLLSDVLDCPLASFSLCPPCA